MYIPRLSRSAKGLESEFVKFNVFLGLGNELVNFEDFQVLKTSQGLPGLKNELVKFQYILGLESELPKSQDFPGLELEL